MPWGLEVAEAAVPAAAGAVPVAAGADPVVEVAVLLARRFPAAGASATRHLGRRLLHRFRARRRPLRARRRLPRGQQCPRLARRHPQRARRRLARGRGHPRRFPRRQRRDRAAGPSPGREHRLTGRPTTARSAIAASGATFSTGVLRRPAAPRLAQSKDPAAAQPWELSVRAAGVRRPSEAQAVVARRLSGAPAAALPAPSGLRAVTVRPGSADPADTALPVSEGRTEALWSRTCRRLLYTIRMVATTTGT